MKKLLLSLLAVFATTSAFAVTDELKISSFNTKGTAYADYTYTSATTKVAYGARTGVNGSNFQFNNSSKQTGSGVWSTENPDNKLIKSISFTDASDKYTYSVYGNTTPYSKITTGAPAGTKIYDASAGDPAIFDISKGYTYFYVISGGGAVYPSSITVEYVDEADPRTFVDLSFPEKSYEAFLGEEFTSPELTCAVDEALAFVKFESSDESVATVDAFGNITIVDDGVTTITAYLPEDNETYYGSTATYELVVKDPNAIETVLNLEFFGNETSYTLYTKEDAYTKVEYTTVYYNSNGMQFNTNNANGKGSGIAVTAISPNYIISKIDIKYNNANGNGLNIYKQSTAFKKQSKTVAIDTSNATKVGETVTSNATVIIGAPAFAIVPTGTVYVESVSVTYAKKAADDGSEYFECEAFQDYMVCKDDAIEITLPEDAPEVKFEVANSEIASIENGTITGHKPGNTKVTASWDAVPGKWMAGVEEFTIFVKYSNLAEVLADAEDPTTGFVNEGQRYIGNFPITIAADLDGYNYVTDGTAWALFYFDKKTAADHNHGEGSVIDAGWSAIYSVYNDLPEFTGMQHSEITDTKGEFTINSYDDLTVDEKVINEVLILKDVTFTTATPDASNNLYNGAYSGQDLTFMNRFEIESVEAGSYDVKAAVGIYKGEIQVWPIAYTALEATTAAVHVDAELKVGEEIKFTGLEEGAHVYYRHGGENPDHTNVFVEETTPADAPRKAATADVNTEWTYNHTTHPLTYQGEPMQVKYYAKAPGKAPSAVNELNVDENGSTTGIESIAVDAANGEVEYFNLQGQRVANPTAGLYIMRQGNEVRKALVK